MKDFFTVFGQAAQHQLPEVIVSGRHAFQAPAIPLIVEDVVSKLCPRTDGRLLEIGCGTGLLLRPLASMVKEAVGIDHFSLLQDLSKHSPPGNLKLLPGQFPDVKPEGTFDHILVYSVLHYMMGVEQAHSFVDNCLSLLAPGGRLLIADLTNGDANSRFADTQEGKQTQEEYAAARKSDQLRNQSAYKSWNDIQQDVVRPPSFINDAFVIDLVTSLRNRGYESYLLPQGHGLPFNMTREDLLVRRRL